MVWPIESLTHRIIESFKRTAHRSATGSPQMIK
jgi:hypothetical protein